MARNRIFQEDHWPCDDLVRSVSRSSDIGRALGTDRYPSDIYPESYLTGLVVRSPYAHCRVKKLDVSAACKLPGIHAIVTADDIPGNKFFGKIIHDQPVLVVDKVRSVLDALCLIAAETEEQARAASAAIKMDLEALPVVNSAEEAMQPDAPKIHPDGNIIKHFKLRHGDVEQGFSGADVIIENKYTIPSIDHAYIETEAGLAEPTENGIRIFVGGQAPFVERAVVAALLDLPEEYVEIIDVHAGGSFGGKLDGLITLYIALLAWKTKQPVRMVFDRSESMRGHCKRHSMTVEAKTGATRDGCITAMQMRIVGDTGSYAGYGPALMTFVSMGATGCYDIPNVHVDTYTVYTNNIMAGAMRGWGNQATAFVVESQIDQLAVALNIHPLRFRWLNALKEGSIMAYGQPVPPGVGVRGTIEAAAEYLMIDLDNPPPIEQNGIGFASVIQGVFYPFGREDVSEVEIRVGDDGVFEIYAAASDLGQGLEAMIRLVFCRAMGNLSPELVRWMPPSTGTSPNAGSTGASRQTGLTGNAVWGAAIKIREQILELAAIMMGSNPEDIQLQKGQLWDKEHELHLAQVLEEAKRRGVILFAQHRFAAPPTTGLDENGQGNPFNQYTYGIQVIEVGVDKTTGEVQVLRVDAFYDAGRIVNPLGARKQIEGSVVMGLGYALTEEFIMHDGIPVNDNLTNYLIPTICDAPPIIESYFVGKPISFGELGARGIAEPALIPTAPAIINAIYNATGARVFRIPATPERVLGAIEASGDTDVPQDDMENKKR